MHCVKGTIGEIDLNGNGYTNGSNGSYKNEAGHHKMDEDL